MKPNIVVITNTSSERIESVSGFVWEPRASRTIAQSTLQALTKERRVGALLSRNILQVSVATKTKAKPRKRPSTAAKAETLDVAALVAPED